MSFDTDAQAYITAVEAADGQSLQPYIQNAINDFVVGCKSDNNWTAMQACCLLAGPRTLAGALTPLKGSAPVNINFVSGDMSQLTGLKGNGTTKYLNSNRNNNADPQNSHHLAVYVTEPGTISVGNYGIIGTGGNATGESVIGYANTAGGLYFFRSRSSASIDGSLTSQTTGYHCINRYSSSEVSVRLPGHSSVLPATQTSQTPRSQNILVFGRDSGAPYMDGRMSFYSIGSVLTSNAALKIRVDAYMAAIATLPNTRRRRHAGGYGL